MSSMLTRNFGTARGLVRLGLSYVERSPVIEPDAGTITRLVFVCHGNICRSAYAEAVARDLGLHSASFGLSTSTGKEAHGPAQEAAIRLGHRMAEHRTTKVEDFALEPGDYLLGMEHRHIRKLSSIAKMADVPRGLLGQYASPPMPHLHDPYLLDPAYMDVCLRRVESAVEGLAKRYPGAKLS